MVIETGFKICNIGNPYSNCGNFAVTPPVLPFAINPGCSVGTPLLAFSSPSPDLVCGRLELPMWSAPKIPLPLSPSPDLQCNFFLNNPAPKINFFDCWNASFSAFNMQMTNPGYDFDRPFLYNCRSSKTSSGSSQGEKYSYAKHSQKHYKSWNKMTDEEIYDTYGKYTRSITKKYNGNAEKLNKYLKGKGVLENKGNVFMDAQEKYGISASVLVAICMLESGKGTSDYAKNKNNVGGIRKPGSQEFRSFKSVEECVDYMASLLKSNYVDNSRSLNNLSLVNAKYCPVTDKTGTVSGQTSWASKVDTFAKEIEKA